MSRNCVNKDKEETFESLFDTVKIRMELDKGKLRRQLRSQMAFNARCLMTIVRYYQGAI